MADWYDKFKKDLAASEGVREADLKPLKVAGQQEALALLHFQKLLKIYCLAKVLKLTQCQTGICSTNLLTGIEIRW